MFRPTAALCAALLVAGCGSSEPATEHEEETQHEADSIALTSEQIAAAAIVLVRPGNGASAAAIEAPALLESDPDATRVVAAPIAGRVVSLTRNLGDQVVRGQTLAVIESREGAALLADVERARARAELARVTLARDEALYARGFRPLREVQISRAGATEAEVSLRMAQQQVAATGAQGGGLNRIAITAPITGRVIARPAILGQNFMPEASDTELFRIANLDHLQLAMSVAASDAARIRVGATVEVHAGERHQSARVRFIAPSLDEATRQVRVLADLENRAGQWRAGEPVQARIAIANAARASQSLTVPAAAVQTIEGRPAVFVRTASGFRVALITLGRRDGAQVAVTAGLNGSETIAAANSFIVKAELGKGEAEHEH